MRSRSSSLPDRLSRGDDSLADAVQQRLTVVGERRDLGGAQSAGASLHTARGGVTRRAEERAKAEVQTRSGAASQPLRHRWIHRFGHHETDHWPSSARIGAWPATVRWPRMRRHRSSPAPASHRCHPASHSCRLASDRTRRPRSHQVSRCSPRWRPPVPAPGRRTVPGGVPRPVPRLRADAPGHWPRTPRPTASARRGSARRTGRLPYRDHPDHGRAARHQPAGGRAAARRGKFLAHRGIFLDHLETTKTETSFASRRVTHATGGSPSSHDRQGVGVIGDTGGSGDEAMRVSRLAPLAPRPPAWSRRCRVRADRLRLRRHRGDDEPTNRRLRMMIPNSPGGGYDQTGRAAVR